MTAPFPPAPPSAFRPVPAAAADPGALEAALAARFTLRRDVVVVGPHRFVCTRPADMDDLLDRLAGQDPAHPDVRDERFPYWADLWPSARALARFLLEWSIPPPPARTLEIGCGLGLPGLVAAARGARVTWTDYLPDALAFAALNAWRNLDRAPDVQRLDWRRPRAELAADLVLAADVVYEVRSFDPLIRALHQLLRPGGALLLAEPQRPLARSFFHRLPRHGLVEASLATLEADLPGPVTIHLIQPSPR